MGGGWGGRVRDGCHGSLTIATDKRLQSIEEFPHISCIIGAPRDGVHSKQLLEIISILAGGTSLIAVSVFFRCGGALFSTP